MNTETGGPAFPNPALANEAFNPRVDLTGMSLRDYFAAKAMQALISNSDSTGGAEPTISALFSATYGNKVAEDYARLSFRIADAMIRARAE